MVVTSFNETFLIPSTQPYIHFLSSPNPTPIHDPSFTPPLLSWVQKGSFLLTFMKGDYVTLEEYIDWDFDIRIQKIGPHYRAFQRKSPFWKGNVGNMAILEDLEMTERYKIMVDECAKLWGGLDICALDLVHCKNSGLEYILELNDTG
eukprot:TRINITY_DN5536_c0_g2_i3.p2 TRINITY_DN5536_c0_g2~~TRINITY_DN5536_c0_g2_i3.p2  ORF type:complete len:148 (-),score=31.78 TRINITY_DN5536_c0_g2_i3:666-1109(-)